MCDSEVGRGRGRGRGREREGEGEGEGERGRVRERERAERLYLCFQLIFFGPLLFTCVGAFMVAERGNASSLSVEKFAGQVSHRNEDISETFLS